MAAFPLATIKDCICGRLHRPLPGPCSAGLETVAWSPAAPPASRPSRWSEPGGGVPMAVEGTAMACWAGVL